MHIAVATVHGMDYLVTWNCTHIANATLRHRIEAICRTEGYEPPIICTRKNSWRFSIMARDPIVDEVRQFRDAYAKRFHYDLEAICHDIRTRQTQMWQKSGVLSEDRLSSDLCHVSV